MALLSAGDTAKARGRWFFPHVTARHFQQPLCPARGGKAAAGSGCGRIWRHHCPRNGLMQCVLLGPCVLGGCTLGACPPFGCAHGGHHRVGLGRTLAKGSGCIAHVGCDCRRVCFGLPAVAAGLPPPGTVCRCVGLVLCVVVRVCVVVLWL